MITFHCFFSNISHFRIMMITIVLMISLIVGNSICCTIGTAHHCVMYMFLLIHFRCVTLSRPFNEARKEFQRWLMKKNKGGTQSGKRCRSKLHMLFLDMLLHDLTPRLKKKRRICWITLIRYMLGLSRRM